MLRRLDGPAGRGDYRTQKELLERALKIEARSIIRSLCDSLPRALPMSLRVAATSGRSAPKCRSSIFKTRSKKSFFVRGSPKAPWALPRSLRVAATSGWSGPSGRPSHTEGIAGASFED